MFFESFLANFFATIFGGIVLTFIFFLLKEKLFPVPRFSGRWYFKNETIKSAYNPYINMELRFTALLTSEGNRIFGTYEKTYEISTAGNREYVGKDRSQGEIKGYILKKYFGKDIISLHLKENGLERKSSTYIELKRKKNDLYTGSFISLIADSEGLSQ